MKSKPKRKTPPRKQRPAKAPKLKCNLGAGIRGRFEDGVLVLKTPISSLWLEPAQWRALGAFMKEIAEAEEPQR